MNTSHPKIALTPGEPAGIGPDILLQLASKKPLDNIVIFADKNLLAERANQLQLNLDLEKLSIVHVPLSTPCKAGELNKLNAAYVLRCLELAGEACLRGEMQALVTGPVHKGIINEAGILFSGHTEFLAKLTRTKNCVMLLANNNLRVALLTTHIPLRKVADAVTSENLRECIRILNHDLKSKFKINSPRIAVCGLNPHAGEDGHIGTEEQEIIIPTLNQLRTEGLNLIGPLPADTAFTTKHLEQCDAVLALYHDQGLPVIKAQGFGETVNITLGLPIIRTSVDHGTALSLAGTGKANESSLKAAIESALKMLS